MTSTITQSFYKYIIDNNDINDINDDIDDDYLIEMLDEYICFQKFNVIEQIVNDFGIFKAQKIEKDEFGKIDIADDEFTNYAKLFWIIMRHEGGLDIEAFTNYINQ